MPPGPLKRCNEAKKSGKYICSLSASTLEHSVEVSIWRDNSQITRTVHLFLHIFDWILKKSRPRDKGLYVLLHYCVSGRQESGQRGTCRSPLQGPNTHSPSCSEFQFWRLSVALCMGITLYQKKLPHSRFLSFPWDGPQPVSGHLSLILLCQLETTLKSPAGFRAACRIIWVLS